MKSLTKKLDHKFDRIHHFDLLRGFFIFLAMWQHFGFYLNVWYINFFKDTTVLNETYFVHKSMIGQNLPLDNVTYFVAWFFTPWVSQVYLTLAAFNLSRRNELDFSKVFKEKIKIFSLILVFFIFENFLVAPNLGEAISFYPIMAWMFILAGISFLYRYFGVKSIWILLALSFTRWFIPEISYLRELLYFIQTYIHDSFELDAQIDYFLASGCIGFLLGYYYHHRDFGAIREIRVIGVGFVCLLVWYIFGQPNSMNYYNIFDTEHLMAETFFGTLCILGTQLVLLPSFLLLEKFYNFKINIPVLDYIVIHSLSIFAIHRILFVFFFAPIMIFIGTLFNLPLLNT